MASLWGELKRRNVLRVGTAYLVTAWLLVQVSSDVAPALNLPPWVVTLTVWLLLLGLVPTLLLAWMFELTPQGLQRDRSRHSARHGRRRQEAPDSGEPDRLRRLHRLDLAIIAVLVTTLGYTLWDRHDERQVSAARVANAEPFARDVASTGARPVVLVLPFRNLGDADADAHFTDGLTEELIHALAAIPELAVLARSTSFALRSTEQPATSLRERFGVDWVVEGSVRRGGKTLRISAQLVDAGSGVQRWNRSFDRSGADALATQAEIAREVSQALGLRSTGSVPEVRASAQAQALYLQARSLERIASVDSIRTAHALLEQALQDSPDFVRALLHQVIVVARMPVRGLMTAREARDAVEPLLHRLRQLAPDAPETRAAEAIRRSWIDPWNGRRSDAERHARDWEELSRLLPDYPHALVNLGVARIQLGQFDLAQQAFEQAARTDPLDQMSRSNAGVVAGLRGDAEAYLATDRALLLEGSEFSHVRDAIASAEASRGRYAEAHRLLAECIEQARLPRCHATLSVALIALDRPDDALLALEMGVDHTPALQRLLPVALFLLQREGAPTTAALIDHLRSEPGVWGDTVFVLGPEFLARGEHEVLLALYREFNPELFEEPIDATLDAGVDLFLIGRALALAGDAARARQHYSLALSQFELTSPLAFPYHPWRVLVLEGLGRREEAIALLQRLAAVGWSDARALTHSPSGRASALAPEYIADPRVDAILSRMRAHNAAEFAAIQSSGHPLLPVWGSKAADSDQR